MRRYTVNESDNRGVRTWVRRRSTAGRRSLLITMSLILVSAFILWGNSISAFASSSQPEEYHKYYTYITVEEGDTLWDLADTYKIDHVMSRKDFIKEVCRLNHITEREILKSGDTIAIAYYSKEIK